MIITLDQLKALDACKEQRELFFEVFGEELTLPTDEDTQKALATTLDEHEFDRAWVLSHFLTTEQKNEYFEIGRNMPLSSTEEEWENSRWVTVIQILTNTLRG